MIITYRHTGIRTYTNLYTDTLEYVYNIQIYTQTHWHTYVYTVCMEIFTVFTDCMPVHVNVAKHDCNRTKGAI